MRIRTLFSTIVLLCFSSTASADIIRVDANEANEADYRTLQDAHDGANPGDTLYVAGSGIGYGSLTLDRQLLIFGPGYFLDENPDTQALISNAMVDEITFLSGSRNSLVSGLYISGAIDIRATGVMLQRNRITHSVRLSANNIALIQNYMTTGERTTPLIRLGDSQNILIANNFLSHSRGGLDNEDIILGSQASSSFVMQNTMAGDVVVYNATVHNNILLRDDFQGANNDVRNNIGNGNQFGSSNDNQENVDMSEVFVTSNGNSTDGQWQLRPGGPAEGMGINGKNIGMFGGETPYVLSGIPSIPNIYFFSAPAVGSTASGLPVSLKVRANN